MKRRLGLAAAVVALVHASGSPAHALPTMIRLGYTGCVACHYAPQGGGPLNPYGRSIDEAQSLRGGEYRPRENRIVRALSWNGRIAQDLRLVFPMQRAWSAHEPAVGSFRPRLQYRNYTQLPLGFAAQVAITGEPEAMPRPALAYDPPSSASTPIVNVAMLRYRPSSHVEVAAGRDQLPSGVNMPDLSAFVRQRNRLGYYDSPAQVKVDVSGPRYRVVPFVYAPGSNEAEGARESGAGTLAEVDPFGNQHAVLGINLVQGRADHGTRRMIGAHARLGFGAWGILAEHDVTDRDDRDSSTSPRTFRQHASFAQVFWAAREWLVASAGGERLWVQDPFAERANAGRLELTARLTSAATIGVAARIQQNEITRRVSHTLTFQLALKTVY